MPISQKEAASKVTKSPSQPVDVMRMRLTEEQQSKAKKMVTTQAVGLICIGGG